MSWMPVFALYILPTLLLLALLGMTRLRREPDGDLLGRGRKGPVAVTLVCFDIRQMVGDRG